MSDDKDLIRVRLVPRPYDPEQPDYVSKTIAFEDKGPTDPGPTGPGYHLIDIPRGELGEISKIREELDELLDAASQGVKVMELIELSDLVGAIEAYLERHHVGTTFDDLIRMKDITRRAFKNGRRRPK